VEEKKITLRRRDENEAFGTIGIDELVKIFDGLKPPKSKKRIELEAKMFKIE
jgi:hypothetical protein